MKPAFLKDEAFLADVESLRGDADRLHLWWLGQSGFLVQWRDTHLLFDPYLSDSLTKKYAGTDKPHVRMTERVVAPERLDFIDILTSTHNHTDHLDAETLNPIIAANPSLKLLIPEANRDFVADRLDCDRDWPIGIADGEHRTVGAVEFIAVPAAHTEIDRDDYGRSRYLGYIAKLGPFAVYHSGDTILYEGMTDILRHYPIDVALLPINGNDPARRVAGNLDGAEAAQLAHDIGAKCVIPCHYDMFEFNTADPDAFEAACKRLEQPYRTLKNGERHSIA